MAKTNKTPKAEDNAELRTISLLKILNTYSDENHELSTKNIMDKLQKECGVTVHRTTVGKNIKQLADCGFDIYTHKTTQNRYYLASRLFEMPELKLLADAVESAGFITEKKSEELIEKLCRLTSVYEAEALQEGFSRTTGNPAMRAFTTLRTRSTRLLRSGRKLRFTIFITVRAKTVC
jgi:biotin operon repressor